MTIAVAFAVAWLLVALAFSQLDDKSWFRHALVCSTVWTAAMVVIGALS